MSTDPDTLVDIASARSEFEASIMVESLRARDIPAFSIANAGMTLQWEVAATNPFRISVRQRDAEFAREVLRSVRADSVDIDWSEVDVGTSAETAATDPSPQAPAARHPAWGMVWVVPLLFCGVLLWLLWNAFARPMP